MRKLTLDTSCVIHAVQRQAHVRKCFHVLAGIMRLAVRDRLLAFNPCEGVQLPAIRRSDTDERTISREAFMSQLLPVIPDRHRALVALAGGTGLRWGECAGLRWDAVDLDAEEVHVVRVAVEVAGPSRPSRSRSRAPAAASSRCRRSS